LWPEGTRKVFWDGFADEAARAHLLVEPVRMPAKGRQAGSVVVDVIVDVV